MRARSFWSLFCALGLVAGTPAAAFAVPAPYQGDAQLLVDNGETFEAIKQLIAGAQRSVLVDYYIFGGRQAQEIVDLLAKKQEEGVVVRILLDKGLGTLPVLRAKTEPVLRAMRQAQLPVRFYPHVALAERVGQRHVQDHNKVVIVDQNTAIVGSMNFGDEVLFNHESSVRVTGNAARELAFDLVAAFARANPLGPERYYKWPSHDLPRPDGDARIRYVPTGLAGAGVRTAIVEAIEAAERSVAVEMFLFADPAIEGALSEAHGRGVDVRVLVDPGQIAHLSPLGWGPEGVFNMGAVKRLEAAGVPVRAYRLRADQKALHTKAACIDGRQLLVGSTNWSRGGLDVNNETMLQVDGGAAPARFMRMFEEDWAAHSAPFDSAPAPLSGAQTWLYQALSGLLD